MLPIPKIGTVTFAQLWGHTPGRLTNRFDAEYQLANATYGKAALQLLTTVPKDNNGHPRRLPLLKMAAELPYDKQAAAQIARGSLTSKPGKHKLSRFNNYELALYLVLASDNIAKMDEIAAKHVRQAARVKAAAARIGLRFQGVLK